VVLPRGLCRLSPIEATPATSDPTLEVPPAKLLREPLFWASAAAFVGVVVGLAGAFSMVAWWVDASITSGWPALADVGYWVGHLAVLSLLGVPALLGGRSRALRIGTALLLVWLAWPYVYYLYPSLMDPKGLLAVVLFLVWVAIDLVGSAALLSLALGAFSSDARRLGAVLLLLGVPGGSLFYSALYALTGTDAVSGQQLLVTTSVLFGDELGVPEACLFALLGAMLLSGARGKAIARVEEKNCKKALRLYEVGLAKNDPSVVEEVVSEDFRDPRRGVASLGKAGMGCLVADLRASYPDLEVSVEDQEAEGAVVRTRLVLSGTDRGRGVMWYPPTGRRVSFEAEFADRFRGGELVEHTGWVDTDGLLRQLGHHREG
jgi:predicted ester cyclase